MDARRDYVPRFLKMIAKHDGPGVAVFIRDPNPSWLSERYGGMETQAVRSNALRDYGVGAQILVDLGVREMVLLASAPTRLAASAGYGLKVIAHMPIAQKVE